MLSSGATLTDEESREVTTMQLRNVLDAERPRRQGKPRTTTELLLMFAPPLLMMMTAVYLLSCYPNAVFLWGDGIERYEALKQTRTLLWGAVVGTTVVGLLTNAFRAGLTSWLSG
jgi:hypothetical protein